MILKVKRNSELYPELRLVNAQIVEAITDPVTFGPLGLDNPVRFRKALWVVSKLKDRGIDPKILFRLTKLNLRSYKAKLPATLAFSTFKEFQKILSQMKRLELPDTGEPSLRPP